MEKAIPAAEAIKLGDLDENTAWMMFDESPEAQLEWMESLLTIPNERRQVVDFKAYPQQRQMLRNATGRDITLKGRQTRASSLILARNLRPMTTRFGVKQLVMTQDKGTTTHFRLRIRHHLRDLERRGWKYDIALDNDEELVIAGLENHYVFGSGEQQVVGRGYSGHIVHLSELAHWRSQEQARDLIGDILPAVPGYPHGQFDIESTPNGAEDVLWDYVQDSRPTVPTSRWTTHFYPWCIEPRYKVNYEGEVDITISKDEYIRALQDFQPSPEESDLMESLNLSVDQILWRREMVRELAKTGMPFVQEFVEDRETCFVARGDSFFASPDGVDHLKWYRSETADPVLVKDGLPWKGAEVSFFGSNLRIWEPPRAGQAYVGWVDSAGGGLDESADFSVLVVVNAVTMRHVATLRLKCAPDEMSAMVCAVMAYYNHGLLGGERDAFGATVLAGIQQLRYPNLWYYIDPTKPREKMIKPWAHPTQTRNRILTGFKQEVFSHSFTTMDKQLVLEMGAFTWQKARGREQLKAAGKGQKDDLVIAAAGCTFIADQASAAYRRKQIEERESTLLVGPGGLVVGRDYGGASDTPWLR